MGPCVATWLLTHPIIHFFCLLLNVLFTVMRIKFSFSHLLFVEVLHYICSQPLDPMGIHLFRCMHGGEKITLHDVVRNTFMIVARDVGFMCHENKPMSFYPSPYNLHIVKLTLCY